MPLETTRILTYLESILADIDSLFLSLYSIRNKGILLQRKLDRLVINLYDLLDNAINTLYESHQIKYKTPIPIKKVSHKANTTNLQTRKFLSIIRKINNNINIAKNDLQKLKKKTQLLESLSITQHIIPEEKIVEFYDFNDFSLILTTRTFIFYDKQRRTGRNIPLNNIQSINYKKTLRFKGCEVILKTGEKVRIPIDPDLTVKIKRKINRIKNRSSRLQNLPIRLQSKRISVRPNLELVKTYLLKLLLNKHRQTHTTLL